MRGAVRSGGRNRGTGEGLAGGREALDTLARTEKVDLVLTDMSMPGMDGAELVREIRAMPRFAKLPVYVITADVEMQNEYGVSGFDDMLIKPITLEKLKELLGKFAAREAAGNPQKA